MSNELVREEQTPLEIEIQRGFKALLIGPTGTGKTHALRTLLDADLDLFVIALEPGVMEVLGDLKKHPRFHYRYIPPVPIDWDNMIELAQRLNNASAQTLANVSDPNKRQYRQFVDLLTIMSDFKDHRGDNFGPVDSWTTDRVLAIDSMTGFCIMLLRLVVGCRPVISQGEWGAAMGQVEVNTETFCANVPCHLIFTGHVEREFNEVMGTYNVMVSTLGKKLSPKVPRFFSDVIYTKRDGANFSWSTIEDGVELKARNVPWAEKLRPSFVPLVEQWRRKVETEPLPEVE